MNVFGDRATNALVLEYLDWQSICGLRLLCSRLCDSISRKRRNQFGPVEEVEPVDVDADMLDVEDVDADPLEASMVCPR